MTTTKTSTIQQALSQANPNTIADALKLVDLGKMFPVIKVTVAGLTAAASVDLTSAAVKAAATIVGINALVDGEYLPAIGSLLSLRVTAGAAAAGERMISDVGGTASATLATLSDDGTTLLFEANVTGFVLVYSARPAVAVTGVFETTV